MDKYGCDRPDLRFGLQMQDITDIVKDTTFQVFSKPIEEGGIVKCIKVSAKEQGTNVCLKVRLKTYCYCTTTRFRWISLYYCK